MHILGMVLFTLLVWTSAAEADCSGSGQTWSCTAGSTASDVQSAVNSASSGATIALQAGSYSWTGSVSWTNKGVHIQGAGQVITVITHNGGTAFDVTMNAAGVYDWRISDMTILTSRMKSTITINSGSVSSPTKGWRVDHVTITNSGAPSGPSFYIHGITWGLIDHVTFNGTPYQISSIYGYLDTVDEASSCTPHCFGYVYWNRNLNLGTDEAVYFEDIVVDFDGSGGIADVFDLVYGGSAVVRHSKVYGAYIQTHSTRNHEYGGMKYEVYNNIFSGRGAYRWALLRSGTGVLFNNTVTGYELNKASIDGQREDTSPSCLINNAPLGKCDGTSSYDGNVESTGWPCLGSCGRGAVAGGAANGRTMSNTPLYNWKSGSSTTCATGGLCDNSAVLELNSVCGAALANYIKTTGSPHSNGQVDYVNNGDRPKPGYTPYTYPHPLTMDRGRNRTAPSPPNNIMIR